MAQTKIPKCIQKMIDNILAEPVWNPPASITKYSYLDKITYLVTSDCCDQYISLYDESCNYICAPSGGKTGQGDRRCMNFYDKAKLLGKVWSDERPHGK
ncbi:unnamed protein product [Rotaria sordida]|uniref:DUF6970 domain-containing protein n=1 Tax=Rotaria sordida TaxID=392033 RepID=A0A818NXV4_9BILA|nr:unnamed protein product [Rotaria sordida]CAF1087786.1 unnamed protein product [Rotaria sordida]CAF1131925.1 unnamed protein product [Rotaria sordida]CAF1255580.1 unnamed protein product [Rotaria sordida]CAF1255897.1 unnamed protein product [Rotaria sordida]